MATPLPTRKLGRNGPPVTAIGAGLMSLGSPYGPAGSDEQRFAYLDGLLELGVTFWDTADRYGDVEDLLGKWFTRTGKRSEVFLATKFGTVDPAKGAFSAKPEYVAEAIEKSLRRLQTGWVDLYYLHRVDGETPIEETVRAMAGLKREGKIRYLGLSEVSATTLRRACEVEHIDALQTEYSPFTLDIEFPQFRVLDACKELGVALVAYSPLGRGFLTGSIKSREDIKDDGRARLPRFSEENFPKNLELVVKIQAIAQGKGVTPAQIVLAWLLAQWEGVIPIPGTRRISAMKENAEAASVELSEAEVREIREVSEAAGVLGERYPPGLGGELFGDTPDLGSK
jgi:aryl-alcohol dehydrogenase-like predicted oxidoreductase